jgi:hypothetical protein
MNRDHRDWPGNLARPDTVIEDLGQLLRFLRQLDPASIRQRRKQARNAEALAI